MKTKTKCIGGCGTDVERDENDLLTPDLSVCPNCLISAVRWGLQRWVEAGAPKCK